MRNFLDICGNIFIFAVLFIPILVLAVVLLMGLLYYLVYKFIDDWRKEKFGHDRW